MKDRLRNRMDRQSKSGRRMSKGGRPGRFGYHRRLTLEPLESRLLLSLDPHLLADINQIQTSSDSSNPTSFIQVNNALFFTAWTSQDRNGLWKTDGTAAGTVLIKGFADGYGLPDSTPKNLTNVGGTLFFSVDDHSHGSELWKSDGTTAGTVLVKNINPRTWISYGYGGGRFDDKGSDPQYLTNVGGMLFFRANDGKHGKELWKSDGTEAGTVLVKDINTTTLSYGYSFAHELTNVGGLLFFSATDGIHGDELWKSDGTEAGTVLVKDINATSKGPYSIGWSEPSYLTNVGGTLFFNANDGTHGGELWRSDGTNSGTVLVKDILPGIYGGNPKNLTNVAGMLFFTAVDSTHGYELWKSNGTAAGTMLVKNICLYGLFGEDGSSYPSFLTNISGTLFFSANDGTHGDELWKSDGTDAGTVLVKDINSALSSSSPKNLTNVGGTLFFTAYDGIHKRGLWKSDGTATGTAMILEGQPTGYGYGQTINNLANFGGVLFFRANDGAHGYEIWKSDGTSAATAMIKDLEFRTCKSNPQEYANVNGTLFFIANDGTHGYSLWKSGGTETETVLVSGIFEGTEFYHPDKLTNVGGTLFFTANDGTHGKELWKSDGTAAGTMLVKDITPGSSGSYLQYLTNVGGVLFFSTDDGINGNELWKSDGTAGGTMLVKNIRSGKASSFPSMLTNVAGTLYFVANYNTHSYGIWKSNGTDTGTVLVKDLWLPNAGFVEYLNLTNVGGTLFFTYNDGPHGCELWKSDGTEAGTLMVKDIHLGNSGSNPDNLTDIGGTLFFTANDGIHDCELWKSNGTAAGTVLVKDINPYPGWEGMLTGIYDFYPMPHFANLGGTLFFRANDGSHGCELWKSDGTAAGTVLVKDINTGIYGSGTGYLTNAGGMLFFTTQDSTHGFELWKSDGTEAGTVLVMDFLFGTVSSYPQFLTAVGGRLFFTTDDGIHGREPWVLDVDVTAPRIAGVYVKGTAWSNAFLDSLDAQGLGCASVARLGYAIPAGTDQLKTLPWTGIDTISVRFDEDVTVTKGSLTLLHADFTPFDLSGATFSYNTTTFTATWTLSQTIAADALTLAIASVADAAGNALDGEWIDQTSSFPSGNGAAGGDFVFHFNVVPGDVNRDGSVTAADRNAVKTALGAASGEPAFSPYADLSGDGLVISNDLVMAINNLGKHVPSGALSGMSSLSGGSPAFVPQVALVEAVPSPAVTANVPVVQVAAIVPPAVANDPPVVDAVADEPTIASAEAAIALPDPPPSPVPALEIVKKKPSIVDAAEVLPKTENRFEDVLAAEWLQAELKSRRQFRPVDAVLSDFADDLDSIGSRGGHRGLLPLTLGLPRSKSA
jgi:ELWxxDGT repeat protein